MPRDAAAIRSFPELYRAWRLARVVCVPTLFIVPGSPALVQELSLANAASHHLTRTIRDTVLDAVPDGVPVDIVCPLDEDTYTAHTGSLRAWGAPQVQVGGGNHLGELVVRYVLGDRDYRPAREKIGQLDPEALTVVVVDGPAGVTPRAPLALVPGARETHEELQAFIAGNAPLPPLEGGVLKPELWYELAALSPVEQTLLAADDSLGVGRYVGVWTW